VSFDAYIWSSHHHNADGLMACSVSTKGSREADFDAKTWPELYRLALTTPEAGVHLQGVFDNGSSGDQIPGH
jgi:hypothetical protein